MRLIGRDLSPYTRKVAIWCAIQGRPLERSALAATDPKDAEAIKAHHPGLRVPALVLDDGTTLVDSFAICDWLDDSAPDKRLVPATGLERRTCMQRIALAHATTEKIVGLVYETNRRPEAYHWPDWRDRLVVQITGGFEAMEAAAPTAYYGGDTPDGADIATVCAYQMAEATNSWVLRDSWRGLKGLADRAMTIPAFKDTYPG
ncbi:MAG: glutathione S-transferase family protein [Pseudomonadota bacterium]